MLDVLAERLARDVDAGERGVAGRLPRRHPAREHANVRVSERGKLRRAALGEPLPTVAEDDRNAPPRDEPLHPELEPAEGQARGVEEVALAERALLAEVQEGELVGAEEERVQLVR